MRLLRPLLARAKVPSGAPLAALATVLALLLAGCGQQGLQPASVSPPVPLETGTLTDKTAELGPAHYTIVVPGVPTDVYAILASGAHKCWLGPTGPLRKTHIFQAEAAPPAAGGNAQILLHERDPTQPDQRGARAFRIALTQGPGGTKVGVTAAKIDPKFAEAMTRDVEVWARGGEGCQLRVVAPPVPEPAPSPAKKKLSVKPRPA